jgi:nucleoside-diphosphate-sugar epimerase
VKTAIYDSPAAAAMLSCFIIRKSTASYYDDGNQSGDFISVDDVVNVILIAAEDWKLGYLAQMMIGIFTINLERILIEHSQKIEKREILVRIICTCTTLVRAGSILCL